MAKLSLLPPDQVAALARRLADSGVAVTVLPTTDLFLMGRDQDQRPARRGRQLPGRARGELLALSNNILNPATPYGDCSLIRIANLYANVLQVDRPEKRECFHMLTERSARLLNLEDYGFAVGHPADVVIINAQSPEQAIAEIAQPLAAFKNGRQTMAWNPPEPSCYARIRERFTRCSCARPAARRVHHVDRRAGRVGGDLVEDVGELDFVLLARDVTEVRGTRRWAC